MEEIKKFADKLKEIREKYTSNNAEDDLAAELFRLELDMHCYMIKMEDDLK